MAHLGDPADWPVSFDNLREIDAQLRCPICKDYLKAAMILSCHHNFCSECIRRALDKESNCPSCREPATLGQLRKNWVLDQVAINFEAIRPTLLAIVVDAESGKANPPPSDGNRPQHHNNGSSQNLMHMGLDPMSISTPLSQPTPSSPMDDESSGINSNMAIDIDDFQPQSGWQPQHEQKRRRTSSRVTGANKYATNDHYNGWNLRNIEASGPSSSHSSLSNGRYPRRGTSFTELQAPAPPQPHPEPAPPSSTLQQPQFTNRLGHINCPICSCAMPESKLNSHLDDYCLRGNQDPTFRVPQQPHPHVDPNDLDSNTNFKGLEESVSFSDSRSYPSAQPPKKGEEPRRLPKESYNVMTDKRLRKILAEAGLSTLGDKATMARRHGEYVTIFNANCDSSRPKSNRQLVQMMEQWDRTEALDRQTKEKTKTEKERQELKVRQIANTILQTGALPGSSSSSSRPPLSGSSTSSSATSVENSPQVSYSSASQPRTTTETTTAGSAVNPAKNSKIEQAHSQASAYMHALRYKDEYRELIEDVKRRQAAAAISPTTSLSQQSQGAGS